MSGNFIKLILVLIAISMGVNNSRGNSLSDVRNMGYCPVCMCQFPSDVLSMGFVEHVNQSSLIKGTQKGADRFEASFSQTHKMMV